MASVPLDVLRTMHTAVRAGNINFVSEMLGLYPEILHEKVSATRGMSWLHAAARSGKRATVEFFLAAGLPVDLPDDDGATPLRKAASSLSTEVVEMLLERGADPDGGCGQPPLHAAVNFRAGCEPTLLALLRRGPNLEALDIQGRTALIIASKHNNIACVKMLLSAGANVFASYGPKRRTALDIGRHHVETASLLEAHIAVVRATQAIDATTSNIGFNPRPLGI